MKTTFSFIILLSIFLISCERKIEIPKNSILIAKYVVFEDSISKQIIKDLDSIKPFDKMNDDFKKPFKLDGKVYEFETEFKLSNSRLIRLYEHEYHSFDYSKFSLKKIKINRESIGLKTSIKFSKSLQQIIDYKDTIEIEKVYPKEKLILVKRNDQRINIYEYK